MEGVQGGGIPGGEKSPSRRPVLSPGTVILSPMSRGWEVWGEVGPSAPRSQDVRTSTLQTTPPPISSTPLSLLSSVNEG